MCQSKKGMSALQIHRQIGSGSYETAWYMCTRIRAAMKNQTFEKLIGEVEADETYIGGKDKNKHWNKRSHAQGPHLSGKTMVIGAISRKGNVVCQMIEEAGFNTLENFVKETVSKKVTLMATDENFGYRHLGATALCIRRSLTAKTNTLLARLIRTRLKASGACSSAELWAATTR